MSDTRESEFYAEHLLQKSKTNPLRAQMQAFVDDHGTDTDLATLRSSPADGEPLSELVKKGREERL